VKKAPHPEKATRLRSAGGVVVKGHGDDLRVALMRSGHGTWVLPKGGIEEAESPQQAAEREIGEEIGIRTAELVGDLGGTEHGFRHEEQPYRKRVEWFLFRAAPDAQLAPNPDENALDCGWFTAKQALHLLSHADQRRVLRRAVSLLNQ
jgi:8-oxo-dGTP pyrophosphatase MutT (NUDIX family)